MDPLVPSDDTSSGPPAPARLLGLTAEIVSAHASRNQVAPDQLPELIRSVHRALGGLGQGETVPTEVARPEPAVSIKRSVQHDRITCLECGARMKMLKRHLAGEHGLTPEGYRERWGLPRKYPMVAPDYAAVRSGLAKARGLGRKRGSPPGEQVLTPELEATPDVSTAALDTAEAEPAAIADTEPAAAPTKRRGRKRDAQMETTPQPGPAAQVDVPTPARGRGRHRAKDTDAR